MPATTGIELTLNLTVDELRMIRWALGEASDAVATLPQAVGLSDAQADQFWSADEKIRRFLKMADEVGI